MEWGDHGADAQAWSELWLTLQQSICHLLSLWECFVNHEKFFF